MEGPGMASTRRRKTRRLILMGSGGHAKVLADAIRLSGLTIEAVIDVDPNRIGKMFCGIKIEHEDALGDKYKRGKHFLVNGLGSISGGSLDRRSDLYWNWRNLGDGWPFASVIHPSARIAKDVELGEGVQVMCSATINGGAKIGVNTIINTGAIIEHDVTIEESCHIAPGAIICGGAYIEDRTHIGCGAVIIQGKRIGQACTVGAGSVVNGDVYRGSTVAGVPARDLQGKALNWGKTVISNVG